MGYVYHYDKAKHTVVTVIEGNVDVPLLTQIAQDVFSAGQEQQCTKFLFDVRDTTVTEPLESVAEFALQMEKTGIRTHHHVAVVYQNDETEHRLFAAMSKNRGYSRVRHFYDVDAANTWLSHQD